MRKIVRVISASASRQPSSTRSVPILPNSGSSPQSGAGCRASAGSLRRCRRPPASGSGRICLAALGGQLRALRSQTLEFDRHRSASDGTVRSRPSCSRPPQWAWLSGSAQACRHWCCCRWSAVRPHGPRRQRFVDCWHEPKCSVQKSRSKAWLAAFLAAGILTGPLALLWSRRTTSAVSAAGGIQSQ
jgi:hypothetical protein